MKIKLLPVLIAFICCTQLAKAQTAPNDCATRHIGDYCFNNTTKATLHLKVTYCYRPVGSTELGYKTTATEFVLKPGESNCIKDILSVPGVRNNFIAINDANVRVDYGDFVVEQCKAKTYNIK
jgi:hypothetical protein